MTYTPKPGDKVTSPLLVGEWKVYAHQGGGIWMLRDKAERWLDVHQAYLTPVAPPLPPEPSVGSVVRAHGQMWMRQENVLWWSHDGFCYIWAELAAAPDLSPVVAVDDLVKWMESENLWTGAGHVRAEFGGWMNK